MRGFKIHYDYNVHKLHFQFFSIFVERATAYYTVSPPSRYAKFMSTVLHATANDLAVRFVAWFHLKATHRPLAAKRDPIGSARRPGN